jgi:hypothetical protein
MRELSDRELVTLAAVHVSQEFAAEMAALIEPDYAMDDAGEITATEWPYRTKASVLLLSWVPAGKPS